MMGEGLRELPNYRTEPLVKILLIDDNAPLLASAARVLRARGHEVEVASNGLAGLRLALELLPDRIICDLEMPGINGAQVYERLPPELQERLFLWTGSAPETFPRPVIDKPCNMFEMMSVAEIA